jgi:hypothetical protein
MEYLIVGLLLSLLFVVVGVTLRRQKSNADIEQLRVTWGKPSKRNVHFPAVRKFADCTREKFHRLSEQTISDIDFLTLFAFVDRTVSKVGQQFLFRKLIEPSDKVQDDSEDLINRFSNEQKLRETVQLCLLKLASADAYFITTLLNDSFLLKPKWIKLLPFYILVISAMIVLAFKIYILLVVLLVPITVNLFLHFYNKENTQQFTLSIPQLNTLIEVSRQLNKTDKVLFQNFVEQAIAELRPFQKKAKFIRFNAGGSEGDFVHYVVDIVKVIFLIEVWMLYKLVDELQERRKAIETLFEYVGNIDASISIASLRSGNLKTCKPSFIEESKVLSVRNIYHPLISGCVRNSLEIHNKSVLITGSNMSGKSTFLRTLAINSILAQTIFTCFADEFITPIVKQFSSIRIDDNLYEGKSYYFQEVNVMSSLIAQVNLPHQNLFLLDEIFKGTNTVDRVSAAKAVLSYLTRNGNIVVVTTHDVELADMLKEEYDLYHFSETVEGHELRFDHRIKFGVAQTSTALKLLSMANYPPEIIDEATQLRLNFPNAKIS